MISRFQNLPERGAVRALGATLVALALCLSATPSQAALTGYPDAPPAAMKEVRLDDGFTLRWGATTTNFLPPEVIDKHDLQPTGRGVLSLVLLKDLPGPDSSTPVPASVTAVAVDQAGNVRDIKMLEVTENGMTSYMGTFDVENRDHLQFEVQVRSEEWDEPRKVTFDRRFFF